MASHDLPDEANLRYITDEEPGYRRKRWGRGFTYLDEAGEHITDEDVRARLEALAIPPAWQEVWISPDPRGHIQATGRDDKGRKQYVYHPRWEELRQRKKFDRMAAFGQHLPLIRQRVNADLQREGLPHDKVVAIAVRLLDESLIRVGSQRYARRNETYGLTTLRDRHATIDDVHLTLAYTAKGGQQKRIDVDDPQLAALVKTCQEIPGYELFQYYDDAGGKRAIDSADVNAYLQRVTGEGVTAKDFRTWGGSVIALKALSQQAPSGPKDAARAACEAVAGALGNTVAVCREYYIHPAVFSAHEAGRLASLDGEGGTDHLDAYEKAFLDLIG